MYKRSVIILIGIGLLCSTATSAWAESKTSLQNQLADIQSKLRDNQTEYDSLQSKIDIYKENLKSKQEEKASLNNQLEVLDQDMDLTKSEIDQTNIELNSLGLEIDGLEIKINDTQDDITENTGHMGKLIRELYDYDQRTYLEIALSHATLSDFSTQVEYTQTVNNEFQSAVEALQQLKKTLKENKADLSDKQAAEQTKKDELTAREQTLEGESQYKESLLSDVEADEEKFQQLVKDVQAEQNQYNAEISRLEKSARATLNELNQSQTDTGSTTDVLPTDFDPIWPVTGVVTTTFHDPGYIFRAYFEHDAIDIAAPQGTGLKAADSGVVAVVKYDGSASYAYVMIVHADNFATIYGHVSAVYVEPDQVVQKGQVIAAVGGYPGTPGAGPYTTGPHVHFGVRLNGIPVDPLLYLP